MSAEEDMALTLRNAENVRQRVLSRCERPSETDCWPWTGEIDRDGYGVIIIWDGPQRRRRAAHRAAYVVLIGEFPADLVVDHLCRNRSCVNPAHLEPVTRGENVLRGEGPSAKAARSAACGNGHEYTPETTYTNPKSGVRACRICTRDYRQKRSAA
jgi:hypothetical protein